MNMKYRQAWNKATCCPDSAIPQAFFKIARLADGPTKFLSGYQDLQFASNG